MLSKREFLTRTGTLAGAGFFSTTCLSRSTGRTISFFGAVEGGKADCTKAFTDAAASGLVVAVPSGRYLIEGQIVDPGGARIEGIGRPAILAPNHAAYIRISGGASTWSGFRIITDAVSNNYQLVIDAEASDVSIIDMEFINANSGIHCGGPRARLQQLHWRNALGQCLRLDQKAVGARIQAISVCNGAQGLLLCEAGASGSTSVGLKKWLDVSSLTPELRERLENGRLGADAFACVTESGGHVANAVSCADSIEGGITATGDDNVFEGGAIINSGASGINLGGSRNVVRRFRIDRCKNGITFVAQAGGLARQNRVEDSTITRSTNFGLSAGRWAYREWSPGPQRQRSPTAYCYLGQNIYQTTKRVTAFGTTPPTHVRGTSSDGLVPWTFVKSFTGSASGSGNVVVRTRITDSGIRDTFSAEPGALVR